MGIRALLQRGLKRQPAAGVTEPAADPENCLAKLDEPFRGALLSLYHGEPQIGSDGQRHGIDRLTWINTSQGMWIYELCRSTKPEATLEIGMANGVSTLFFLAAIAKNQAGRHTAIDPHQMSDWKGVGLANVRGVGMEGAFRFMEERSDRAATDLARGNAQFEIVFIDGNHRFDDVLADFYLYAPLCNIGGYVIFDDLWMKSIQAVAAFVRSNRSDFVEVATPEQRIAVFKRVADDTRLWDHFLPFAASGDSDGHK